MANIKIFGYKNKDGVDSWKVLLVVADTESRFGGISLGKALLSEHATSSFEDIIEAGVAFDTLDHMPGRGEGLTQFNDCYKQFLKPSVTYTLAEIPAAQVLDDIEGFKKAVAAIKQAEPVALKKTIETKEAAEGVTPEIVDAVVFLGGISIGSNHGQLASLDDEVSFDNEDSGSVGGIGIGVGSGNGGSTGVSAGASGEGGHTYSSMYGSAGSSDKVADALKTIAEALGYKITLSK